MSSSLPRSSLTHLERLEAEAIHIMREVVAEAERPVMLYSVGKDSAVMLHLARKAFYPSPPPFPLLHVDTTWKFRDVRAARPDGFGKRHGTAGLSQSRSAGAGHQPVRSRRAPHRHVEDRGAEAGARQVGLRRGLRRARRDEEKSRAKERIFSFRTASHGWDPKNQRPELWNLYNARKNKGDRSASSRSATGPSWTSGSTST
jgi:sulfate adenylyltransferase subunit 2